MTKYVIVSGGVISGIGKGVIASSTALLLKMYGLRVTSIKIDPYLNIDAGTLSPLDHGEVFVLDDGGEVDLDLGNYERFLDITLSKEHNITTGKIFSDVISRERRGDFAGKTVQVVPHITNSIQDWIERVAQTPVDASGEHPDVCIVELGGTVGDIESAPFVEAMRQFQFRVGVDNFALIHVSLVPIVGSVGEQKTKPTQHSVALLRGAGLTPDFIACRSSQPLDASVRDKISMFCHVSPSQVIAVHDCTSVYHVPLLMGAQGFVSLLETRLSLSKLLEARKMREGSAAVSSLARSLRSKWVQLTERIEKLAGVKGENSIGVCLNSENVAFVSRRSGSVALAEGSCPEKVVVAVVGKYTGLHDAYLSVKKSLEHAGLDLMCEVVYNWIEATDLETPECASPYETADDSTTAAPINTLDGAAVEERLCAGKSSPTGSPTHDGKESRERGALSTALSFEKLGICIASEPNSPMLNAEAKHKQAWQKLREANAVVIPGGFGVRGIEGKVLAANYARTNKIPCLGLCLGMQVMVIEYARTLCGVENANSEEFAAPELGADKHAVVNMPEIPLDQLGGTMRLGSRTTVLDDSKYNFRSVAKMLHDNRSEIKERHRHRYEVNPKMIEKLEACGLHFVGRDTTGCRMEILELPSSVHPYYVGTQYHPEYLTRPLKPCPLFMGLLMAGLGRLEEWKVSQNTTVPGANVGSLAQVASYKSTLDLTSNL